LPPTDLEHNVSLDLRLLAQLMTLHCSSNVEYLPSAISTLPPTNSLEEIIIDIELWHPEEEIQGARSMRNLDDLVTLTRLPYLRQIVIRKLTYGPGRATGEYEEWTWEAMTARVTQLMPHAVERGLLRFESEGEVGE
jgi:hypothetical protein